MSDHLLGLRLKRKPALPWVEHFSDPWSDNPFRRRFFLSNFLNRRYEAQVVRHADRVIFTSLETLDLVNYVVLRYLGNFYGNCSSFALV